VWRRTTFLRETHPYPRRRRRRRRGGEEEEEEE